MLTFRFLAISSFQIHFFVLIVFVSTLLSLVTLPCYVIVAFYCCLGIILYRVKLSVA